MRAPALAAAGLLCAASAGAAPSAPIAYETFSLANGMHVLLARDPSVPVVTAAWMIPGGSRQEERGRSGFAHLFEHLMFEGSAHAPKGQFDKFLEANGADNNASSHEDFTFFYEELPSHALPVALWLDADRLSALALTEKSVRNQIDVVKEEKRMRVDNQAYAPLLWVDIASRTFANWANSHPTIGTFADLDAATLADARSFFERRYAPSRIWLALVGDFDPRAARTLVERYFGWIPNHATDPAVDSAEPAQAGERSFSVSDAQAKAPGVAVVWTGMPSRRSPEYYALTMLGRLLFEGKSSRLYQRLVKGEEVATSIDEAGTGGLGFPVSDWSEFREPGLFGGFVVAKSSAAAARVKGLVYEEARRIASAGVDEAELERLRTKFRSDWILGHETTFGRAQALLYAAVLDGDPGAANTELDRFLAVDGAALKAAAAKFLAPDKANIFSLRPGAQ